jgi:membrane protease YdiL (CAAX protease family)
VGAERPAAIRAVALLAVAGLSLIAYTYLSPPLVDPRLAASLPVAGGLPGDLPAYAWRFLLSFVALGLLPLAAALVLGESPRSLGLARPGPLRPRWLFPLLLAVVVLGSLAGAYNGPIFAYYPYSRTLTQSRPGGVAGFLLHALFYLALYYLPWELFFRGILVFPLVRLVRPVRLVDGGAPSDVRRTPRGEAGREADRKPPREAGPNPRAAAGGWPPAALLAVACLQALPSTLLHFGHPWSETLVALPFGLVLGWLALATGSLLPGLALHASAGIFLDLFILLRRAGRLP